MPLTFVHAADFHLGADLRRFGSAEVAEALRDAQFQALEKTLVLAVEHHAAFVAICGDLFDNRFPPELIIKRIRKVFDRFPAIKILILPGTHDFLSDDSILAESRSGVFGDNVVVLNDSIQCPYPIAEADCGIYFRPNRSNRSAFSPIQDLNPEEDGRFHIALAHGSLSLGGLDLDYDFPLDPAEIKTSGFDYLALGHWHKYRLEKIGKTTVVYPGIAQPLSFSDPETGSAAVVSVDDNRGVSVDPATTSTIRFRKISETIYHPRQVARVLDKTADLQTIVKIDLKYSDNFIEYAEVEEIIKNAGSRFLLISPDDPNHKKSADLPESLPADDSNLLIDNFLSELDRIRQADSPERAGLYEKAAELGRRIIRGEV